MNEAVDIVLQADEGAEAGELGDFAGDEVADFVILVDVGPGIFGELFQAEGDSLVGLVDFEHNRFDVVTLLQDFGRMIDLAGPGDVRDVDHTIETIFQFHERAVTGEVADLAFDLAAWRILLAGAVPWVDLKLTNTQRNFLFFAVDAEHDRFDFLFRLEDVR